MLDLSKEALVTLSKEDKVVTNYMEKLYNINEDPRFQSYMSAEEDTRKLLNTYKEKAEEAYEKAYDKGAEETKSNLCIRMYQKGYDFQFISELLGLSETEIQNIINKE